MSSLDIFGPMFLPSALTSATEDLLKLWFPEYLAEMEIRENLRTGSLVVPQNYGQRNTYTGTPGEQLPVVVVLTPGILGTPSKSGSGAYRATWRLGVGTLIAGETEEEAFFLAGIYGTCVMAIMEHHRSINGISSDTNLLDYSIDDLPVDGQIQKLRAANLFFAVDIDNIVSRNKGPKIPSDGYGIVEKVVTEIVPQGI